MVYSLAVSFRSLLHLVFCSVLLSNRYAAVAASSSKLTTQREHLLEVVDYLRSDGRRLFKSDDQLLQAHADYEKQLFESKHEHHETTHPFVVKLSSTTCKKKAACHRQLKNAVGAGNHQHLGSKYALLTTSAKQLLHLETQHPELLAFRVPLLPQLRVDSHIRTLTQFDSDASCREKLLEATSGFQNSPRSIRQPLYDEQKSAPPLRLRAVVSPIDTKTQLGFSQRITQQLQALDIDIDKVKVAYNTQPRGATAASLDQHYAIITVQQCAAAESVADAVAQLPEVQWVERSFNAFTHNRWVKGICDTGDHDNTPLTNGNFTGLGEIIGIADTGIDMKNCYFSDDDGDINYVSLSDASTTSADHSRRKVIQYINFADGIEDQDGHGTHVGGIAAGITEENYGDFKKFAGAAFDAKVSFFDIGLENSTLNEDLVFPDNINLQLFVPLYESGARVISNSWGTSANQYDRLALRTDQFMNQNPDALVVFSQGNSGDNGARSMGSPATCKNCLSVGASLNDNEAWRAYEGRDSSIYGKDAVASFSSQGPTSDGRLKPDVLGAGWWVTSALGDFNSKKDFCDVQALKGTSMSAPLVAAHALMLRQYFTLGYYPNGDADPENGFTPSGALLKAMLVHSGKPMTHLVQDANNDISSISDNDYPSNIQGYGRIQLDRVLHFGSKADDNPINLLVVGAATDAAGTDLYQEIEDEADTDEHVFTAGNGPIRITFAYTDVQGSSNPNNDVEVNQLNIRVESGGDTFLPYNVDNINDFGSNVQMIDITKPDRGVEYTVIVYALDLPGGAQPYALVVTGDTEYLKDSVNDDDNPAEGSSETLNVDGDAMPYIIVLGLLVLLMAFLVWFFRRISKQKSSILLDPRNFEVTDGFYNENTQDTGMGGRKSIFAKIRSIRAREKMDQEATEGAEGGGGGGGSSAEQRRQHRQENADHRAALELQRQLDRGEI